MQQSFLAYFCHHTKRLFGGGTERQVSMRLNNYYHICHRGFTGIPGRYIPLETLEKIHSGPSLDDFLSEPDANGDISYDPNKAGRTSKSRTNVTSNLEGRNLGQKFKRNPKSLNRKPKWLTMEAVPKGPDFERTRQTVKKLGLATVCEEARCPNLGACWSGGTNGIATATIMLMGDTCTRACRFCSVATSKAPPKLDESEPNRVGKAVLDWGLKYVVLTSVDRDDYHDGGANHIANTVKVIKNSPISPYVEVLTPDFQGNENSITTVVLSGLDVFAHNVETTRKLTPFVRDRRADYDQSLNVLKYAKQVSKENDKKLLTKSSIMVGFGETTDDILETMHDLRNVAQCDIVTLGQYLQPTKGHLKVSEYVTPETFEFYKKEAENMGFLYVASGPLVRSSYKAGEYFVENYLNKQKEQETGSTTAATN